MNRAWHLRTLAPEAQGNLELIGFACGSRSRVRKAHRGRSGSAEGGFRLRSPLIAEETYTVKFSTVP